MQLLQAIFPGAIFRCKNIDKKDDSDRWIKKHLTLVWHKWVNE